jgi:peptidoglycan/LPS O-acetylase OafA/YrhL
MNVSKKISVYIPEIDGLRAIAVLSVILYHAQVPGFDGGFLGVDVFFVISGFLITGIIMKQIEAGRFTFSGFYRKRIRRLFPAMLVVYIVSFGAAFFLFNPQDMERFSGALIYTLGAFSNVYFYQESGYFDADAYLKPLLHTWSLSVEEQFYMLWPISLVLFRRCPRFIIGLFSIASLIAWAYFIEKNTSMTFFMMPFRIFEFGIGAALIWLPVKKMHKVLLEVLAIIGLGLIVYSVAFLKEAVVFQGLNVLVACFGTALLIYGKEARLVGGVLRSKPFLHIGTLSYSLYLVHWPLIVFYKAATFSADEQLKAPEVVGLLLATYLLSVALYYFVESRFRLSSKKSQNSATFWTCFILVTMTLVLVSVSAWTEKGWVWRLSKEGVAKVQGGKSYHKEKFGGRDVEYTSGDVLLGKFGDSNKPAHVAIVGDSHSQHYHYQLAKTTNIDYSFRNVVQGGCIYTDSFVRYRKGSQSKACLLARDRAKSAIDDTETGIIIHAARWHLYWGKIGYVNTDLEQETDSFEEYVELLLADLLLFYGDNGQKIIFIGAIPNAKNECFNFPKYFNLNCGRSKKGPLKPSVINAFLFNKYARKFLEAHDVTFVDPTSFYCDEQDCKSETEDGYPIYSDKHHLSKEGSNLIVPTLVGLIDKRLMVKRAVRDD